MWRSWQWHLEPGESVHVLDYFLVVCGLALQAAWQVGNVALAAEGYLVWRAQLNTLQSVQLKIILLGYWV